MPLRVRVSLTGAVGADQRRRPQVVPVEAVFDAHDVSVFYGAKQALAGVSLRIPRSRITALIGPSGCGKSTFLRSLNRMNDSVPGFRLEGQVLYHGHDLYGEQRRPGRGAAADRDGLPETEPVPEVDLRQRRLGAAQPRPASHGLDERVEKALRGAALWDEVKDRLKDSALGLSGGQQQRLCIARAIAIEPDVLLLDEPASALDPIATASIEDLMHSLKGRFTIVIVTHNMQQAARVADQTAFFSLDSSDAEPVGTLVEFDDTETIFSQPGATRAPATTSPAASAEPRARRSAAQDRVAGDLLEQRLAALPAEGGAGAVGGAAGGAGAGGAGLLHAHDPFDLAQFGVGVLQGGRALDQHLDLDVVADRHLVGEPAEVPLQLGDAGDELVAPALEVDDQLVARSSPGGRRRGAAGPERWPCLRALRVSLPGSFIRRRSPR